MYRKELERLTALASVIQGIISDARDVMAGSDVDRWEALSLGRFNMLRALDQFIKFKNSEFLLPFAEKESGLIRDVSNIICNRNLDLQGYLNSFVTRWALLSPSSVNDFYLADAAIMADLISKTVAADLASINRIIDHIEAQGRDKPIHLVGTPHSR